MKTKNVFNDSDILVVIHIALTSLILALISWSSGCEKKEDLGQSSLGPEIQIKDLAKAYVAATENPDNSRIDPNFFTVYEINQRVELGPSLKYIDTLRTIKCILRQDQTTQIALNIETYLYDQYGNLVEKKPNIDFTLKTDNLNTQGLPPIEGESCPTTNELNLAELNATELGSTDLMGPTTNSNFNKSEEDETLQNFKWSTVEKLLNNSNEFSSLNLLSHQSEDQTSFNLRIAEAIANDLANFHSQSAQPVETLNQSITKVSLHGLSVQNLKLEAPKSVKNKPGCSGISNCIFNATQIQFDIAEWYNATDYRTTRSRWVLTSQLPSFPEGMNEGFGGFLSKCESGFQKITTEDRSGKLIEQEYHITTCLDVLRNF